MKPPDSKNKEDSLVHPGPLMILTYILLFLSISVFVTYSLYHQDDLELVSTTAQTLMAFLTGIILLIALQLQLESQKTQKAATLWAEKNNRREMIQDFAQRYQGLQEMQAKGEVVEIRPYFRAFWSLQFEQFRMWQQGYVPTDTYSYWAMSRCHEFNSTKKIYTKQEIKIINELRFKEKFEIETSLKLEIHFKELRKEMGKTFVEGWLMTNGESQGSSKWADNNFKKFIETIWKLEYNGSNSELKETISEILKGYEISNVTYS